MHSHVLSGVLTQISFRAFIIAIVTNILPLTSTPHWVRHIMWFEAPSRTKCLNVRELFIFSAMMKAVSADTLFLLTLGSTHLVRTLAHRVQ